MSNTKHSDSGRAGKGRWSAKRKMSMVLERSAARIWRLRAASTVARRRRHRRQWQEAFLALGEEGLTTRQEDLVEELGHRMKSVITELAMANELLRERIRRTEDEKPILRWRSKR